MRMRRGTFLPAALGLVLLLGGCGPSGNATTRAGIADVGGPTAPAAPKILTIGVGREPSVFSNDLTTSAEAAGGLVPLKQIPQNYLAIQNDRFTWVPQVAAELVSTERGTWKVNPDGTMETSWKLRPNVKWQDGAPFTADDMVFSLGVYKDPDVPNRSRGTARFMQSASAPDPLTFVVRWSELFAFADQATSLEPLPKHLLEDAYVNDRANFTNSPYLRAEYVGLGPYRLTKWEQGSYLEFSRFDDYYRSRPPLDHIVAKIIPDANSMIASLLAGSIDVLIDVNIALDTAVEVRQRWAGTDNRVFFVSSGGVRWLEMQLRPEYARPVNGFINTSVRQAFAHGTNRDQLVDIMTYGFSEAADSWISQSDERRPLVEDAIRKWPYDPARAQQLLAEAGWTRGGNGVLVHSPSGERFELEVRATQAGDSQKFLNVLSDDWKVLGVQSTQYEIPAALTSNNEFRTTLPGITHVSGAVNNASRFNSRNNASAENRWVGVRGGYVNARQDMLADRVDAAITPADRISSLRDLLTEVSTNLPTIPLYWGIDSGFTVAGVSGVNTSSAWNVNEWDKR